MGKVFGKTFRIVGLDGLLVGGSCSSWVLVEQDFHRNFWVNVTGYSLFFRPH